MIIAALGIFQTLIFVGDGCRQFLNWPRS